MAPCCKNSKRCVAFFRIFVALVMHCVFWTGIAFYQLQYLEYFCTWTILLSMIVFTLMSILHIRELKQMRKRNLNTSGVDSSITSTFILFTPGAMDPYKVGGAQEMDLELFRLQSKHTKIWKYIILLYEVSLPALMGLAAAFWIFVILSMN